MGTETEDAPCRVFGILARAAPIGVLFRRGPSKWVQLIKWNTKTDSFEQGQWFRGRIYERRCDLSPDGSMLIYFASKINARTVSDREYTYAWTAVSKPPWFTALALWPKGDCWHGGGLFDDAKTVWLNHSPAAAKPHPKHQPKGLKITPNSQVAGEDAPVYEKRLQRDGWSLIQRGHFPFTFQDGWRTEQAEIWTKADKSGKVVLTMRLDAIDFEEYGGPYVLNFDLFRKSDGTSSTLGRATWADWDHSGRLVIARGGMLLAGKVSGNLEVDLKKVCDFNAAVPNRKKSPDWAAKW